MFTKQNSLGIFGMDAYSVQVEVDSSEGGFAFNIVGLPVARVMKELNKLM